MNQIITGKFLASWLVIIPVGGLLALLGACGQSSDKTPLNIDYSQLKLAPIKDKPLTTTSANDFSRYLKNGIRLRIGGGTPVYALAEVLDSGQSQSRFSTTNVHEIGVDEDDRLKYDGEYLFLMDDDYFPYYETGTPQAIRIMQTDPATAGATQVATINRQADNLPFAGMYLHQLASKKTLVSLSASRFYAWDAFFVDADWQWNSGKTEIRLHDVTDPANPLLDWQIELEGNLEGSRKIGNKLYLITHYIPNITTLNTAAQTEEQRKANEQIILNTPVSDLLPHYQINDGGIRTLVSPQDCLVAGDIDPLEGYADIITVTSINLDSRTIESSACLNANVNGIYSSTETLYIGASGAVSWLGFSEGTAFHKFALTAQGVDYRGSGWVNGSLGWQDPAFRMSEYQGDLRVVTSQFVGGDLQHQLSLLREGGGNQLDIIATLPNENAPTPIGKPGEDIFAVRFIEDKAYIITYERIDPLYEIDLSDPSQPVIGTALEMPGFARYLHPLIDGWLLGIGHQAEDNRVEGIKLELYDLRNASQPMVKDTLIIGSQGTWSEALYDLKSISYLALDADKRQLAIPLNRYEEEAGSSAPQWVDSGLYIFDITGFESGELALQRKGQLIVEEADEVQNYPLNWGVGRSTLLPEAIYFYQGNALWSAKSADLSGVFGPF